MAVAPTITEQGDYGRYVWVLTSADQIAHPTPPLPGRNEKTIDVRGGAGAAEFNGAVVAIQGTLDLTDTNFKTLKSVPDTQTLSFSAATDTLYTILPHAVRIKPVITSGTVGATGITIVLVVTSARLQVH